MSCFGCSVSKALTWGALLDLSRLADENIDEFIKEVGHIALHIKEYNKNARTIIRKIWSEADFHDDEQVRGALKTFLGESEVKQ